MIKYLLLLLLFLGYKQFETATSVLEEGNLSKTTPTPYSILLSTMVQQHEVFNSWFELSSKTRNRYYYR